MSVSFPKPLTDKEEKYYISLWEKGDEQAREILIERNLRLVAHIAKKYATATQSMDDYISTGTIGLIKAVNTYRSGKSVRLATYAARCIENEILMSIRASKKTSSEVSINLPIGTDKDGNEISLNDILGTDPDAVIDDINTRIQVRDMLNALGSVLTDREKQIIIHRYGILGTAPRTQREVAAYLGISRSYVSRIEKRGSGKAPARDGILTCHVRTPPRMQCVASHRITPAPDCCSSLIFSYIPVSFQIQALLTPIRTLRLPRTRLSHIPARCTEHTL